MKKALKIIGIILLTLLFIAAIVLYAIFPTQTKDVLTNIWAILNTPLPIVGFTTLTILLFEDVTVALLLNALPNNSLAEIVLSVKFVSILYSTFVD